ncbi:hypothetical protein CGH27_25680, partial [Vibrio parahaemolyticus]
MAFYCIDSETGEKVHVNDWVLQRNRTGSPLCGVCKSVYFISADKTPKQSTHFSHPRGTKCPTIKTSRVPYEDLVDIPKDPVLGEAIKKQTFKDIHRIFNKCCELCENLNFPEFREMFNVAARYQIWDYVGV